MDSSTVLLNLLREGYEVKAISVDYGQKHSVELGRAKDLVQYLQDNNIQGMLSHNILKLDLSGLLHASSLVKGGVDVPEGHYAEDNMKSTVVPNRNKVFSSIIQMVALDWSADSKSNVVIALGLHSGDHAVYPDTTQTFRDKDYEAFLEGNYDAERVTYYTPFMDTDKTGILKDGLTSCEELGIDFDEVYKRTLTSYKPDSEGRSDYKSGSSVERVESFLAIGRKDPVEYTADWDTVVKHVEEVLKNNK